MTALTSSMHTGFVPMSPADVDRDRAAIGRELGDRYRVDRYLARGGFATVWQAQDLVEGRDVAIKHVEPTVTRSRDFFRELRALLVLSHPNVVRLVNFLDASPSRFLILELCRGGSLRAAISSKRRREQCWTPDAVSRLVKEIAGGLAAAHAAGLTHRDLKPENVLFAESDPDSTVKLADFGLAGLFHDDTGRLRSLTGSPAYMAPEQFAGRFNPASDVYALGIIAFELLTGDLPFRGTPEDLARQHLNDAVPTQTLPPPWATLLPRMLAKNPDERPTAADVVAALIVNPAPRAEVVEQRFDGIAQNLSVEGGCIRIAFNDRVEIIDGEPTTVAVRHHGEFELRGNQVEFMRDGRLLWSKAIPCGGLKRHLARHADGTWAVTAFDGEPVLQVRDADGNRLHSIPLQGIAWQVVPWSAKGRFALRIITGEGFRVFSTRTAGGLVPLAGSDSVARIAATTDGILAVLANGSLRLWNARRRLVPLEFTLPPGETLAGLALTATHALTLTVASGRSILRRIRRPDPGESP
jgi:hypothetical protein